MGVKEIVEKIKSEAEAEYKKIIEEARAQANEKLRQALKEAENEANCILENARRQLEMEKQRMEITLRLDLQKRRLSVQKRLVDEVFENVKRKIVSMPDERYFEFLTGVLAPVDISGDVEIILNKRDRQRIGNRLVDYFKKKGVNASLSKEDAQMAGGVILKRGKMRLDFSLELLLEQWREALEGEVIKKLFE